MRLTRIPQLGSRFAVIDVETTGLRARDDRVVEMACVVVEGAAIVSTWSTLVDQRRPIPWYATRVHGIRDDDVAGQPAFADAQRRLHARCAGRIVAAHNATFDLGFLPALAGRPHVCTLALARRAFPNAPNHKNQTLRKYLGLGRGVLIAHRALGDALITAELLLRCLEELHAVRARRRAG